MILILIKVSLIAYVFCALGSPGMIFAWYQRLIYRLPEYLSNPLGSCHKCFTGQVCFWYYLITYFHSYNLIDHLFFVSLGIFLSLLYDNLWTLLEQ
jgi:hypothetical protein